ncbi:MAG: DUF6249 domain-containing protein [Bacteroidales bacterium]
MEGISNLMITAVVFAGIYAIIQLFVKRKERLLLIEKGTNSPEMKSELFTFSSFKFGLFFIGLGLGVLAGSIVAATTVLDSEVAYFSMIFLFGGLALVLHHYVDRKKN